MLFLEDRKVTKFRIFSYIMNQNFRKQDMAAQ